MTATAAMVTRLRRMVAEPGSDNGYSDLVLEEIIERYPTLDADGLSADDEDWAASYDLNAAASEVWGEKAAACAAAFDFNADGASFSRSQAYTQAMRMMRRYGARRAPGTVTLVRVTNDDDELGDG